jgi:hypothetical protein
LALVMRALLYATGPKRTFRQGAANGGYEPSLPNAVPQHVA